MTEDLGALLDHAIDAVLVGAQGIVGTALPASVTLMFDRVGQERPRRVDRAEALALVEATRTGAFFERVNVSVLGIHDGRTVIELKATPMAALTAGVFKTGGVCLGRARFRKDGTVDWSLPVTRAELETNGRDALEACETQ